MAARAAALVCLLGLGVVRAASADAHASPVAGANAQKPMRRGGGSSSFRGDVAAVAQVGRGAGIAAGFLETAKGLVGVQVTPAVVQFVNSTRILLNTTVGKILDERDQDEKSLDDLLAMFGNDTSTLVGKHTIAGNKNTGVGTLRQAHMACRQNESAAYSLHVACRQQEYALNLSAQAAYGAFQAAADTDSCPGFKDARRTSEALWDDTADEFKLYLGKLEKLRTANANLASKTLECNGLQDDLNTERAACDTKQSSFESGLCSYASYIGGACTSYNTTYNTRVNDFNILHDGVESRVADRKVEYEGLSMADCFLEAVINIGSSNDSSTAALDACQNKTIDTTLLDLKAYAIPSATSCLQPPPLPCADSFEAQEYGNMPNGTEAAECDACTAST